MRRTVLIFLLLVSGIYLQAQQTIKGKVLDSMMKPLNGATVQLNKDTGNVTVQETLTDSLGNFSFEKIDSGKYVITASFVGFATVSKPLHIIRDTFATDSLHITNVSAFVLTKTTSDLNSVTVTASIPAIVQKADTTQFSASQYKVNPDATTEDLVKKMPGITVASDGTVTAQGETVKKVLVDGKEFFGDDASAALKNLPADIIDKIQVFDKLSDQAQFTGFDDGNTSKTINVVTKGGMRSSQFGKLYAGYGTDKRYLAGGNLNFFDGDKRISVIGLANNVNQQNFSQQDILGALNTGSSGGGNRSGGGGGQRGGQGGRGGNGGGAPGGFGGGAGNFLTGTQQGINSTNSFGINYSDTWSKKLNVTGSYFFNNTKNTTGQLTNRQTFITADSSIFYKEDENSSNNNYNHRLNLRMEYKIDSFNQIIFTPVVGFQNNNAVNSMHGVNSLEDGKTLSDIINNTNTHSSGYNFNATLLYRHAFAKRGRSISVGITPGVTDNTGKTYQDAFSSDTINAAIDSAQLFRDRNSHTKSIAASFSYTEPVGKKAMIQFNYNPSWQNSTSKQYTYDYNNTASKYNLLDTSISNLFDNDITKHSAGLSYRLGDRFNNFSVGLNYQYTKMTSDQTYPKELTIHKSFNNLLPNLTFSLKLSAKSNIRLMYRAATQTPSVTQLQNVFNNNNPLQVITGNPDLKQAYNNTLSARYIYTNPSNSQSFFFNAFIQQNNNYITNATYTASKDSVLTPSVILATGSQLSKPVNVNGYWNYRIFATYSLPVKFIKSNISINGGFNYTKQPGLINKLANTSKNLGYNGGLSIGSNISEYIDFSVNYTAGYNVVKNTLQPTLNSNYYSGAASANLNLLSKSGWEFQSNITNQMYSGLTAGYNQSYTLWNASIGKKFLKNQRGDLKLSVFDILKQNQSISRNVTESYIEDVQTNVLQRYFMLTFTFKLNNIRTAKATTQKNNRRNEMRPDGPPPDGPPPGAPPPGGGPLQL